MALQNLLGNLALEGTQEELLGNITLLLAAILEQLPRTDGNQRVLVSSAEAQPTVSIAANQTLSTVSTVTACTTVNTVANQTNIGGRDASHAAYALANMGTAHIYNNILVS